MELNVKSNRFLRSAVLTSAAVAALAHSRDSTAQTRPTTRISNHSPLTTHHSRSLQLVSFLNDIEPILTRAGCNAGSCHGQQFGKGGFKLSLAGYDPDLDYESIVKSQNGRRVSMTDPANCLLIKKPALLLAH